MKKLIAVGVVLGLGAAPATAVGGTQKAGRPFLPPPVHARAVQELSRHSHALIQVEHGQAALAVPVLRDARARLISKRLQIWRLRTKAAQRLIPVLQRAGALRAVEPDRRIPGFAHFTVGDPLVPNQWWIGAIGANLVEPPGPGMPVSVIDSGLDLSHPEFAGRPDTVLLNGQTTGPGAGEEHGTAVSSVLAASPNGLGIVGVYPQVVLREWDAQDLSVGWVIAGIEAALDAGVGVINLSLGSPFADFFLEEAILGAFGGGSVIVAAAGNEFTEGNPPQFPASYNHVLTVAATNEANEPTEFSTSNLAVDLAAPGQNIPVAVPTWANPSGFDSYPGTSFAAPLVSGATAWVWTMRPTLDNTQVFDLMRFSARDVWSPGYDPDTGFGVLDIPTALTLPAPRSDHQEPNDDIFHVRRNGLFVQASAPLTGPGRPRRSLRARLDITEDPEDVYRVWVPARRWVNIRVVGNGDVDVELWKPGTPSVHVTGRARKRHLIDGSYRAGTRPDWVFAFNSGRRGRFVYLDVFLPREGPLDASYSLRITTTRT